MKRSFKLLFKLFFSTLYLSSLTFGGGYVIVPLMRKRFVDDLKWIEENQILDLIAISQAAPGAIAINASIAIGYRVAGIAGVIFSVLGSIIPPFIIITVISFFYIMFKDNRYVAAALEGMSAGVAAVIANAVVDLSGIYFKSKNFIAITIMVLTFSAVLFLNINVALIVLFWSVLGIFIYFLKSKRRKL